MDEEKGGEVKPTYYFTAFGLPEPETEYRFHHERMFRFDFAWVEKKVAAEMEGGIWMRTGWGRAAGAHSRPKKILTDMEKQNEAGLLGWRVFRFTPKELQNGLAANFMKRVLDAAPPKEAV